MRWLVLKYLITALVVVLVSEFAKRSDRLGALIAALPLVTLLALIWMHLEQQSTAKIANHAYYTIWYVLPTLPMFAAFPWLLPKLGFWPALGLSALVSILSFWLFAMLLRRFEVSLW
jgi:uncharacterized membrane protein (GlpM family)